MPLDPAPPSTTQHHQPRAANLNPGRHQILASPIITPHHHLITIAHRPSPAFPFLALPCQLSSLPVPPGPCPAPEPSTASYAPHRTPPCRARMPDSALSTQHSVLHTLTGRLRQSPYSAYQPSPTLPPLTTHHCPSIAESTPHSTTSLVNALSTTHPFISISPLQHLSSLSLSTTPDPPVYQHPTDYHPTCEYRTSAFQPSPSTQPHLSAGFMDGRTAGLHHTVANMINLVRRMRDWNPSLEPSMSPQRLSSLPIGIAPLIHC